MRRLFSVPASNADVERVLSAVRNLFAFLMSGMAEATAERAMVLKYNMEAFGMWSPSPDADKEL